MAKGRGNFSSSSRKSPKKSKKAILQEKSEKRAELLDQERIFNKSLIAAVYSRSFIYDRDDPNHDRKKLVSKAWNEIGEEIGRPATACHTRWRSLKDTFNKKYAEWKTGTSGDGKEEIFQPTWPWFGSLLFLKDCNKPSKTTGNLQMSTELEVENQEVSQDVNSASIEELSPQDVSILSTPKPVSSYLKPKEKRKQNPVLSNDSVMDKLGRFIESQIEVTTTSSAAFVQFLDTEMSFLCEEDQEDLQMECMQSLRKIKKLRREKDLQEKLFQPIHIELLVDES